MRNDLFPNDYWKFCPLFLKNLIKTVILKKWKKFMILFQMADIMEQWAHDVEPDAMILKTCKYLSYIMHFS